VPYDQFLLLQQWVFLRVRTVLLSRTAYVNAGAKSVTDVQWFSRSSRRRMPALAAAAAGSTHAGQRFLGRTTILAESAKREGQKA
jgi:hypothetical protein